MLTASLMLLLFQFRPSSTIFDLFYQLITPEYVADNKKEAEELLRRKLLNQISNWSIRTYLLMWMFLLMFFILFRC